MWNQNFFFKILILMLYSLLFTIIKKINPLLIQVQEKDFQSQSFGTIRTVTCSQYSYTVRKIERLEMEPSVVIIAPDSFLFKWSKEKEHFYFLFIFLYTLDSGTRNSKRTPTEGINAISHCSPWHFRLLPKFPEADLSCTLSNEITNVPLT